METYSSYLRAPIFDTLNVANPIIHSFFIGGPGGFSSPHDMIKVCSLERVGRPWVCPLENHHHQTSDGDVVTSPKKQDIYTSLVCYNGKPYPTSQLVTVLACYKLYPKRRGLLNCFPHSSPVNLTQLWKFQHVENCWKYRGA